MFASLKFQVAVKEFQWTYPAAFSNKNHYFGGFFSFLLIIKNIFYRTLTSQSLTTKGKMGESLSFGATL